MVGDEGSKQPENTRLHKGRKSTQRIRLLAGMISATNRDGYARASVSAVITEARVSRPTFYDYFTDRDDCFREAVVDVHKDLLAAVLEAIQQSPPEQAAAATVRALATFASSQPERARFLMSESMTGGPRALDARDCGIEEIAELIERTDAQVPDTTALPDIPGTVLIGGVFRLLATRLRRGELGIATIRAELVDWLQRYERPAATRHWHTLRPTAASAPPRLQPDASLHSPPKLAPGRPRLSSEQIAENHRKRIMFAAARLAEEKGYAATTVAHITSLAEVESRVFYQLFRDKQDAFMAVHEFGFQQVMSITAGAFFVGASWPERTWEAASAFAQFLQANPTIAHVGFVEAYAVGPGAVQRVEDSHVAFSIFLQEGYQHVPASLAPPRVVLEIVITAIFEIVYRQVRASARPETSGFVAHMAFLSLAPFLGVVEATEFIETQLQAGR
jgi:AcrR family transcriptional regulator